jgi:hypothetical protein
LLWFGHGFITSYTRSDRIDDNRCFWWGYAVGVLASPYWNILKNDLKLRRDQGECWHMRLETSVPVSRHWVVFCGVLNEMSFISPGASLRDHRINQYWYMHQYKSMG